MKKATKNAVYIGYESREHRAYEVAVSSLYRHASKEITVTPLVLERLMASGLIDRPMDKRGDQYYDLISNAPCATSFALSRFLVPILAQEGWALFTDCDVVFMDDVMKLFALADPRYAVMVVKHAQMPSETVKMDNQQQTVYGRKNWSSVMLFNCDHPANHRLSLHDINHRRGLYLHQMGWLAESEIGELPAEWNWLVNAQRKPETPRIAHFTLGGPFLPQWTGAEHDEIWIEAADWSEHYKRRAVA